MSNPTKPDAWQWRVRRVGGKTGWSDWNNGQIDLATYRHEYSEAISSGRIEIRELYLFDPADRNGVIEECRHFVRQLAEQPDWSPNYKASALKISSLMGRLLVSPKETKSSAVSSHQHNTTGKAT